MNQKLFNNLLLLALFGIALGFFGTLYEGVVFGPKMLDNSMQRMTFWKDFYAVITPLVYYAPLTQLGALVMFTLFFVTPKQAIKLKNQLKWVSIFQVISFALTIYIVTRINLKESFGNIEKFAAVIPTKTLLFNVLSVVRIAIGALALCFVFRGYIETQRQAK